MASTPTAALSTTRDTRLLQAAATFFTVAVLIHNFDHVRRGFDATPRDVFWLGTASITIEVGVVVLICARHRLAPLAAALVGSSLAVGYLAVHFLPERSWASDSITSGVDVSPMTWVAASLELVAAVALAVSGLAAMGSYEAEDRPLRDGFRHPVALAMIGGNALVLIASFAQM